MSRNYQQQEKLSIYYMLRTIMGTCKTKRQGRQWERSDQSEVKPDWGARSALSLMWSEGALGLSKASWRKRVIFQGEVENDKLSIWGVQEEERKFGVWSEDLVSQEVLQPSHHPLHPGAGSLKMGIWLAFMALICTDSLLGRHAFMYE